MVLFSFHDCVTNEVVSETLENPMGTLLLSLSLPFLSLSFKALKEISPCRSPTGPYLAQHRTTCGRQSSEQTSNVITWLLLQWWWVFFLPQLVALYHSPSLVLYPSPSTFSFRGNRHFQDEHGNCKNKTRMVRSLEETSFVSPSFRVRRPNPSSDQGLTLLWIDPVFI